MLFSKKYGYSLLDEMVVSIFLWFYYCFFSTASAQDDMSQVSLDIIARDYLWDYLPNEALFFAANRLEEVIPWLVVQSKDNTLQFVHGEDGVFGTLSIPKQNIDALAMLTAMEKIITNSGFPVPNDIELDIELLRGYMNSLDRYSTIMYKDSLEKFNERIQGQLTGIGCRVQKASEGIRIAEVFPDSPAQSGGVVVDDIITHIDGASIQGVSLDNAVERLRGPIGSKVTIGVLRSSKHLQEIVLKRAQVRIPNVRLYIESDIAHVVIENFSSQTLRGVEEALFKITQHGRIKGLILDLRGNTGGSMWQSCQIVDLFLKKGLVLKTEGKNGKSVARLMRQYVAENDREIELPMIVLINSRSASASEIVSGALKQHKRALLIGQKTHGKGVVQMPHTVRNKPDPVKIKLTVAQYILEGDFSVHNEKGITPDIWLERYLFSEEGFSHDLQPEPDRTEPVFLYAQEEVSWRDNDAVREDYPLSFARRLLLRVSGNQLSDIQKEIPSFLEEEKLSETQLIQEIFESKNIDWSDSRVHSLEGIQISPIPVQKVQTGTKYEWPVVVSNSSKEAISQLYVSFSANSEYMPWAGQQIPVGRLQPNEKKTIHVRGEIPIGLSSSLEKIGVALHAQDQVRSVFSQSIEVVEQPVPQLLVRIVLLEEDPMRLLVSVENLSSRDVRNVDVRLALPNIKEVEIKGESFVEQDILVKGDVLNIQYVFHSSLPIAELPELKLTVQTENRSSKIEFIEKPINVLSEQLLLAPIIHTEIPVQLKKGTNHVEILLEDDGAIVENIVWLDGEKQGWRGEQVQWILPLELDVGLHRIDIQAKDDQGLESRAIYYVDVAE